MRFNELIEKLKKNPPKRMAVAAAADKVVLKAVSDAYKLGIAIPVLCGDPNEINAIAKEENIDISAFEIRETSGDIQAAAGAVSIIRAGRAEMLMKGLLHTSDLLRMVLNKENGLRTGGTLSHVAALNDENTGRTILMTDVAMVPYPDLKTKVELIKNAVIVAKSLGMDMPKVAPLAAVEVVNPDMQATLDAAALAMMNTRGQIKDCIVDGPLAFDLAVSPESAQHKGVSSPAAGCADILLFHNIEAGNSTYKAMTNMGGYLMGGVVMGASVPVVLTSRADSEQSKLYSIAIAAISAAI